VETRPFLEMNASKATGPSASANSRSEASSTSARAFPRTKKAVIERARKQDSKETFNDLIRDPSILEFTGLAERPEYLESDLETALLNRLQSFLRELGADFSFGAQQKRRIVGR
jgi:predicted nuclease of restriction endonuclease-like (RecB) superfamily